MSKIFISYRRDDSKWAAGRIFDRLSAEFGPDDVFMDTRHIGPGAIFTDEIAKELAACQVLLALIGRQWLSIADGTGRRRLDDPDDLVAREIASALDRRIRVIPLLVDGAGMPAPVELPERLARLSLCNALEISESRFPQDVQVLVGALKDQVPDAGSCRTSNPVDALLEAYLKSQAARQEEKRTQYAKDLQRNLLDFYIESRGSTAEPSARHADGEARHLWDLAQPSLRQGAPCFVLADFGQGKTWMMEMFQYRLASAKDRPWIPVSLSLRGLRFDALDKSRPIFDELRDRAWGAAIGETALQACRPALMDYFEKNRFLFLFDAVDEMAVSTKQDREQLLDGIGTLRSFARRSPVLLTCRRSYFYDASQERSLPGRGYDVFYLWPWSREDILAYLRRVHALGLLEEEPQKILGRIEETYSLKDLSSRAMLAAMLVGQWKELMGGAAADLPSLYERHVERAILDWQAPKSWQLERHEIRRYMEEIAFLMFRLDSLAITPEELDEYFSGKFAEFQISRFSKIAESFVRDIRTNSFLLREGSQYVFCHVSIWEFLVARKLARSLDGADQAAFQIQDRAWQYKSIVRNFLVPMLKKENKLGQISALLGKGLSSA